ncbi:hypothetical protein F4818DRAFT_406637 [Hypoxylon cercidicola]|nr:hypothetical protein F4818DRAFT_406637 [Hypoxylon cercidicola]
MKMLNLNMWNMLLVLRSPPLCLHLLIYNLASHLVESFIFNGDRTTEDTAMVQKSTAVIPPGASKPPPTRTCDSYVWKDSAGKGTTAKDLVSGVRFSWDKYQKTLFEGFLKTVGLGFKNADITPLLVDLNLHGYENVCNAYGENVHSIIEKKVRRKLRSTADEMEREDPPIRRTEAPLKIPASPSLPSLPPNTLEKVKLIQPSHPFLKVPKREAAAASSASQIDVKFEPEDPSPYIFTASPNLSSQKPMLTGEVQHEKSRPIFDIRNLQNTKVSPTALTGSGNTKAGELHRAAQHLLHALPAVEEAITAVKSALAEMPENEATEKMAELVSDLLNAFCGVQVKTDYLEGAARAQAKGG